MPISLVGKGMYSKSTEAYYFAPQRMTKIMNEGWACFWHTHIMTQRGILDQSEVIDYADRHSGTVALHKGRINPYRLGLELLKTFLIDGIRASLTSLL